MSPITKTLLDSLPLVEKLRIISVAEAAKLCNLSVDTIKREHSNLVIELSPRRRGIRLADALTLTATE